MDNDIKQILGMTQENMAMLLQITQSQWSMFVCGQRSLPVAATLKLAEMLQFSESSGTNDINNLESETNYKTELEKYIANQIIENNNKATAIKHKLIVAEKKYKTALKAHNFILFLESKAEKTNNNYKLLLHSIKQDAKNVIEKNGLLIQKQIIIKLELLAAEAEVLQSNL
jgi:hypothetical protein